MDTSPSRPRRFFSALRARRRYILAFVLPAAALALLMLAFNRAQGRGFINVGSDGRMYLSVAENFLATGHFIQTQRESTAYVLPFGLPLILTVLRALGLGLGGIVAVQFLLFGGSCLCLFRAEENLFGRGGLAPALYLGMTAFLRLSPCDILAEHYCLFFLCLLLALATDKAMSRRRRVVWLHIAGFLAFAVRPFLSVVYAAAVLGTLPALRRREISAWGFLLLLAVPGLVLLGNARLNARESGRAVLLENYSGGDLYMANNAHTRTYAYSTAKRGEFVGPEYGEIMADESLDFTEKNEELGALARQWVRENPGTFLKNTAEKFVRLFVRGWYGLLVLAFLAGLLGARAFPAARGVLLAVTLLALLLALLTSVGLVVDRYTAPVLPAAAVQLAGLGRLSGRRIAAGRKRPSQ